MYRGLVRLVSLTVPVALVGFVWCVLASQAMLVARLDTGTGGLARYAAPIQGAALGWLTPDDQRAAGHFAALPYTFLAWAVLGSLSLAIALRYRGERWSLWSIIGLSLVGAAAAQTYGIGPTPWLAGAALASLLALRSCHRAKSAGTACLVPSTTPWATVFLIWAFWLLLVGQGVLWLSDLAARGPVSLRYIGLRQLDAAWTAALLVIPVVAWGAHRLLVVLVRIAALWERRRGPQVLLALYLGTLVVLVLVGSELRMGGQKGYPHVSSEAVRLLCALSAAWLMARHFEWSGRSGLTSRSGALALVIFAGCLAVLVITRDLGPLLAIAVALLPLLLVVIASSQAGSRMFAKVVAFGVAWLLFAVTVRYLLTDWLPAQSWAPERLVLRDEAMKSPFTSRLDYASQIAWILEAAGSQGFGLGGVPWCGANALVGLVACTKSSGASVQFGSDYVFTATAAVWGSAKAGLLLLATLALLAITVWAASRQNRQTGLEQSSARLHAWIVVVGAALLMGQVLVSVAGNVGLIPLTGVTQPLLGLGTTALLSAALWVGFALGGLRADVRASGWLSQPLRRYFIATLVGMGCFVALTWGWRVASSQTVQDRLTPQAVLEGLDLIGKRAGESSLPGSGDGAAANVAVRITDPACQVSAGSLSSLLGRLSLHLGQNYSMFEMSCGEAESVRAAARWAISRPKEQAQRLIGKPTPSLISVNNPYRLGGCVRFAGELAGEPAGAGAGAKIAGPCPPTPESAMRLLRSSPELKAALGEAISPVRQDTSGQGTYYVHVPPQRAVALAAPPAWAEAFGLTLGLGDWLFDWQARQEPIKTRIGQGNSVTLSIDLRTQAEAQSLVDCYVGPCERLSALQTKGGQMLEQARARMASVLVVDVVTGEVQAAASGHTPCYAAHHQGVWREGCLPLPQPPAARPWMVVNQALHGEAMCGSLCKLQASLALMRSSAPMTQGTASFKAAIRESQTERFIDNLLCQDMGFSASCTHKRLLALVQATRDLGGSSSCPAGTRGCRTLDLLEGVEQASLPVARLRLMTDPSSLNRSLLEAYPPGAKTFTAESARSCHAQGHAKRWRGCQGEGLVAHVAELFGQGNARASAPGVAQALLTLAQAAEPQPPTSRRQLSLVQGGGVTLDADPSPVAMEHARMLLEAMQEPLKPGGTAHVSCLKSIIPDARLNCRNDGQWVVAGKTGTPLFPHDSMTYTARKQACDRIAARPDSEARRHEWARCVVPPTKWFAFLLGQRVSGQVHWKKAVVVLAERNWNAQTGLIDTPFDRGGSVAAELGLQMARGLVELAQGTTTPQERNHASPP